MIDLKKFIKSMGFALKGIATMVKNENNARIHLIATLLVTALGFYFSLTSSEWLWIATAIALVWILEALNTAIEALVDLVSPQFHPLAGKAKDVAAGAVLLGAISAVVVGGIIFLPKIKMLLWQ